MEEVSVFLGAVHLPVHCALFAPFTKRMMRHSQTSTVLDEAYIRVSVRETAAAFSGFAAVGRG